MEIKEGNTYTTQEMIDFFGVSKATWKKKKEKLLFHFGCFYEYEVDYDTKDYRKRNYKILKQLHEYEPPQKKSVKRDNTYEQSIIDVIKTDNLQTARNVSRIIKDEEAIKQFHHTDGTVYEYTRVRMRCMFGTTEGSSGTRGRIVKKIWCRADTENCCYIELEPKLIEEFFSMFKAEKKENTEEELTMLSDYENGHITREELDSSISSLSLQAFLSAKQTFYMKHEFYPIKVPVYELSAFEYKEQEEEKEQEEKAA